MNPSLIRKNILITGGTSALGASFVRAALRQGARVFFTYFRNQKEAARLSGLGAQGFSLDLSDLKAVERMAEEFKCHAKGLDILIHNAALVDSRSFLNLSEQDWDRLMAVNLKAPFFLTQKLLPLLLKGKQSMNARRGAIRSKVFMVISRAAISGAAGISSYAASKAGLVGLVKSLASQWGGKRILVNAVNPGFMISEMTRKAGRDVIRKNREASVLHRTSDPSEVADFLVYLCSHRVSQISGQVLHFESRLIPGP